MRNNFTLPTVITGPRPHTTLTDPPGKVRYHGVLLNNPPRPQPFLPTDGGAMAAATFGIDVLQKRLAKNLATNYVPADDPDGRSGDPTKLFSDITLPGQPVYGKIVLGNADGNNTWTDALGQTGSYQTVELDCAIVSIGFNNQVVKTNVQGLPFSVKEFISGGDNDVNIVGIYNSTPGVAPIDFIINLNKIFSAPVPIPVTNYFLNNNNIYYVVCMPGCEMPQEPGGYAYQKFTIKAVSDTPPEKMLP